MDLSRMDVLNILRTPKLIVGIYRGLSYVSPKILQNKFGGKPVDNLDTHCSPITLIKTNKDRQIPVQVV